MFGVHEDMDGWFTRHKEKQKIVMRVEFQM